MKKCLLLSIIFLFLLFISANVYSKTNTLPFKIGETLIFNANYGILNGGTFTMSINEGDSIQGHKCYLIQSIAKTNKFFDLIFKVRDIFDSYWDIEKFVSRKYVKRISEGKYKAFRLHYYFPEDTTTYYVTYKDSKRTQKKLRTFTDVQDDLALFYYLRLHNFTVGDSIDINVTVDGDNYRAKAVIENKEVLNTIFGEKECFRVKPLLDVMIKNAIGMFVWFTADEFKIPVKLVVEVKYGKFTFTLKEAKNVGLKILK